MVIRLDIGEYAGVKRWAYEQLGNFRKRASAKAKKKMKHERGIPKIYKGIIKNISIKNMQRKKHR